MADLDISVNPGPSGAAQQLTPDAKQRIKTAVKDTIKKELAKEENGGITAAGHAKSSISW